MTPTTAPSPPQYQVRHFRMHQNTPIINNSTRSHHTTTYLRKLFENGEEGGHKKAPHRIENNKNTYIRAQKHCARNVPENGPKRLRAWGLVRRHHFVPKLGCTEVLRVILGPEQLLVT